MKTEVLYAGAGIGIFWLWKFVILVWSAMVGWSER
jgi:hypothetical protein